MGFSHWVKRSQILCSPSCWLQLWDLWYLSVFLSLGLLPHWLASAFILSQYFMVVMYGLSLSTVLCPQGSTLSCLFRGFWFWLCCFPAVIIAVWITVPQSMDHFSSLLPVSLFLCSDIVSDIVFNSVEFFSLFYFLVADSSLSLK